MDIAKVDIMDEVSDMAIPVTNGIHLKENYVGKNLEKYDSMLVLSHFKGHKMGGFGGALKNMSIGIIASIDPVACDKASVDFIYNSEDEGKYRLIERIESRHGIRTIEYAEYLGIGTTNYELVYID